MKKLLLLTTCLLGRLVAADTSNLPTDPAPKYQGSTIPVSASIALPSMPPIMEGAVHYQPTAAGLEISTPAATAYLPYSSADTNGLTDQEGNQGAVHYQVTDNGLEISTPAATGNISYASAADTSRSLTGPITVTEVLNVLPTPVISIIEEYIDIDQESLDFSNENYDDMIGLLEKCKRLLYLRLNIAALSDRKCFCLFNQLAKGNVSLKTIDFGGPLQWSLRTNKNLNQRFANLVSIMPNLVSYQVVHTPGLIFSYGKAFIKGQVENKGGYERVTYVKRRK